MSAAVVQEIEVVPEATEMSVQTAYAAVKALCDPDKTYVIEWNETMTVQRPRPILTRFARMLKGEAWLVAHEVDADGKRVRGNRIPVCPILVEAPAGDEELSKVEQQMHDTLAELKDADGA